MLANKIILIALLIINGAHGARILGIFHAPSRSHHILGSKLLKRLAERGHDVTMVSPYPFKENITNYRDIDLKEMHKFKQEYMQEFMNPDGNSTTVNRIKAATSLFYNMNDFLFSLPQFQAVLKEEFDLIIQVSYIPDSLIALSHHFKAPVILFSTLGATPGINAVMGNPSPPSYVAGIGIDNTFENKFLQRLFNTVFAIADIFIFKPIFFNGQKELARKYFPGFPELEDICDNIALAFINSHYSFSSPRPFVPNVIPIGGMHIDEVKELPQDLKQFLDSATDGAIFFSLGSNAQLSVWPKDKVDAILNALERTKLKVLMKCDIEFENVPANIKIGKWLPQNDILGHPNIKLFISHGGLLSTIEAIYHAVPILGIPLFGDQHMNMKDATAQGFALKIEFNEINEDALLVKINSALKNTEFRENIRKKSEILRHQPVKPLELAVFWVEHVLKFKGADHLKNEGAKLPLYQYLVLDALLVIALIVLAILSIFYFMLKFVINMIVKIFLGKNKLKIN